MRIDEMKDKVTERSKFTIRALVSVALFCSGVWLVPSGIAIFASHDGATKLNPLFVTIHNTASFLFIIAAVVHVIMNWKVLCHRRCYKYSKWRNKMSSIFIVNPVYLQGVNPGGVADDQKGGLDGHQSTD